MPDESGYKPGHDSQPGKNKNKGHPASLVIFAIIAYIMGAPLIISLIVLIVAAFAWRKHHLEQQRAKMPPIPPKEQTQTRDSAQPVARPEPPRRHKRPVHAKTPAPVPTPQEIVTEEPAGWSLPPLPWEVESQPMPAPAPRRPLPEIRSRPTGQSNDGISEGILSGEIGSETEEITTRDLAAPRRKRPGSASEMPTWRSRSALRHAVVAMTVLGPCRAQDPYRDPESTAATPFGHLPSPTSRQGEGSSGR